MKKLIPKHQNKSPILPLEELKKRGYLQLSQEEKSDNIKVKTEKPTLVKKLTPEEKELLEHPGMIKVRGVWVKEQETPLITSDNRTLEQKDRDNFNGLELARRDLYEKDAARTYGAIGEFTNRFMPTTIVGGIARGLDIGDYVVNGNSGIVTDLFAENHPYLTGAVNLAGDVIIPMGVGKAFLGAKYLSNNYTLKYPKGRLYSGVALPEILRTRLNWDYKDWFSTRPFNNTPADWTPEEIAEYNARVPLYKQIELLTKANGTYLKMPDGSTWKGDPRAWVLLLTPEGKLMRLANYATGVTKNLTGIFEYNVQHPTSSNDGEIWGFKDDPTIDAHKNAEAYAFDGNFGAKSPELGIKDLLHDLEEEYAYLKKATDPEDIRAAKEEIERMELELKELKQDPLRGGKVYHFTVPEDLSSTNINAYMYPWNNIPLITEYNDIAVLPSGKQFSKEEMLYWLDEVNKRMKSTVLKYQSNEIPFELATQKIEFLREKRDEYMKALAKSRKWTTTDDIVLDAFKQGKKQVIIDNVTKDAVASLGNPATEIIVKPNSNVKSLQGGTGKFGYNTGFFRSLLPIGVGYTLSNVKN